MLKQQILNNGIVNREDELLKDCSVLCRRDLGAISHLLELISSEYPAIQQVALLALVLITNECKCHYHG